MLHHLLHKYLINTVTTACANSAVKHLLKYIFRRYHHFENRVKKAFIDYPTIATTKKVWPNSEFISFNYVSISLQLNQSICLSQMDSLTEQQLFNITKECLIDWYILNIFDNNFKKTIFYMLSASYIKCVSHDKIYFSLQLMLQK